MAVPISNVTRRQVYSPSGTGGAGPYSFTFEILANTDIAVYKDDTLLTLTTHYTVTINSNGTGSVTITAAGLALSPTSPTQYAIVGNRTIQRTTDFTTGGDFFANTVNDELDQQTIFAQQNAEGLQRTIQAPQTDPTSINMTLPRASVRANKTLAFDTSGNPTTGEVIGDNRGNWAAATTYSKRDIVKDTSNGNIYYANTAHTSSGSQPISTNADSAKWDLLVDNASAGTSATAAAASASAAATSASNASTSATNAASSASGASTSASNASTSATNAANSATAAAASASTASTQASNASTSATNAATSATNASNSASGASTSATNAASSASSASTSASNASTSATNAASSASSASTSASNASTSATNASNSATAAATSETNAAASAAAAAASFDAFDDIYLGAKSTDPSVDNDGNALTTGDQYFNTTANELRVYNGSTWQAASTVGGTVTSLNVTGNTTLGDAVGDTVTVNGTTTFNNADVSVFGVRVGRGAGNVSTNTAVGASALAANTTGDRNAAFGNNALFSNQGGQYNVGLGDRTAYSNTSGSNLIAIGSAALYSNTTGANNVAIGRSALESNTTASNNTAVGYQAGYYNTTGVNTFVGSQAGYSNSTGTFNAFIGGWDSTSYGAGGSNTNGSYNTALGAGSLAKNTTASNNTAVGYQAGYANQTGTRSVLIGATAGFAATALDGDTHIGYSAGSTQTTGFANTFVGSRGNASNNLGAGKDLTTGTYNTFIGGSAGGFVTTGSKNTILGNYNGNQSGYDLRTASNNIVLSDGDGVPKLLYIASASTWVAGPSSITTGAGTNALRLNTGNGYISYDTSSARYKNNIRDSVYGLSHVMQMRSAQFEYKDTSRSDVGLIAEELDPIIPELVMKNKDGQPDSVSYDRMVSVLVKAIQELKAEVDSLKAQLNGASA